MKGIVILEGPDCTGKSTLARKLVETFNGVYIHATWSEQLARAMWDYHLQIVNDAVRQCDDRLVVVDRLWLSEVIYGAVYRGGSKIPHEGRMLDRILRSYGALNVICLPESPESGAKAIFESAKKRDEMWEKEGYEKLLALCQYFDAFAFGGQTENVSNYADVFVRAGGVMKVRDDCIRYCIADHGDEDGQLFYADLVETFLTRLVCTASFLDGHRPNLVGSPRATHLICGDSLNPKDASMRWPFCEYGNASLWLAEAMHKAGIDESRLLFTNVNDDDGTAALAAMEALPNLNVVCLGTKAAVTLSKIGITNFHQIPHPQWDRRFNRNGNPSYASVLAGALPVATP